MPHSHFPACVRDFTRALCESLAMAVDASVTCVQSPAATHTTANRAAAARSAPASHSTGTFDPLHLLSLPSFVCWLWPTYCTHDGSVPLIEEFLFCSTELSFDQLKFHVSTRLHVGVLEIFRQFSSSLEGPSWH